MPDVTQQLNNAQVIEIAVEGPDGANRMFLCSGSVNASFFTQATFTKEMFTFFVGPTLARREVIRASCAAGPAGYSMGAAAANASCYVASADADWDDEGGRVQVRLEVEGSGQLGIRNFHYHVVILAERTQ